MDYLLDFSFVDDTICERDIGLLCGWHYIGKRIYVKDISKRKSKVCLNFIILAFTCN